jgi:hypothetical protein
MRGGRLKVLKRCGPIVRSISVLAREPTNHITINKFKSEKGTAEKTGASLIDSEDFSGGRSRGAKASDRSDGGHRAQVGALECLGPQKLLGSMTVIRAQKRPDVMKHMEKSGRCSSSGTVARNGTKAPMTATKRRPWATDPQGTAEDAIGKRRSQ